MILQAEHIMECHSAYRYMSNWGVIENHGLFEIGVCLPQSEKTKQLYRVAVKNLEVQVRMQIIAGRRALGAVADVSQRGAALPVRRDPFWQSGTALHCRT